MGFQPFHSVLATVRTVQIPSDLTDEKRAAFTKQIGDAVAKQAVLAESCDAILRPVGEVREEDGALLIEHEPATPFDLDAILSTDDRPDVSTLWWITWSALRAMAAGEAKRTIHGGLQLRSFFIDRVGRVKLADFGLASAIEVVCGRDSRRHLACDGISEETMRERGLSGSWARLDEDAHRENSWIAPRFAPEILAGGMRLNLISDQFSLGAALYELATGVHPLGAELSDPELFGYFVPEPYLFEDERPDWADAFERQSNQAAMSGDQPVLNWAALVYRLLANEPGERFPNFTAALEKANAHVPAEWTEALRVLAESLELLPHEQYDPFLTSVGRWSEDPKLPELWRARLAVCISEVEQLKATEAARKAVEARLDAGYAALDREKLDEARAIATEVRDSLDDDDPLRERVVELERLCDEHERHIQEKAGELAQANLQSALEAFERGEYSEARMILAGMLEDPLTDSSFAQQAQQLLAEIDEQANRLEQQRNELESARCDHGEGRLTDALQRLDQLLADQRLVDSLRPEVEAFAGELQAERKRHEQCLATIAEVETALARVDPAVAEELLATLPADTGDALISERRNELTEACECLRQLLKRRDAAEEQLRQGEAQAASDAVDKLLEEELCPALRKQLTELSERCRQVIEQIRKAQVSDALESLSQAEAAYESGDVKQLRHRLSMVLPLTSRLGEPDRKRALELDAAATRYEDALRRMETAERRSAQQEFDAAAAELDAIEPQGLPDVVVERIATLRSEIDQAREAERQRRARELQEQLEQVAVHLAGGAVSEAEALLAKVKVPPDVEPKLGKRHARLRQELLEARKVAEAVTAADGALRAENAGEAARLLDELDAVAELPDWAVGQMEQLRGRVAKLEQVQRARAVEQARAALQAAAAALETADHAAATKHLAAARPGADLSEELAAQCAELTQAAAELEEWLPKLSAVEKALQQDQLAEAFEDATALLKQTSIPAPIEQRLRAVEAQSREKIIAHRADLTAQLQALGSELEQRGRRVRSFARRIESVRADVLATQEHQDTAAALAQRFEALPRPRTLPAPIAIAAAAIVVLGGVGWYLIGGKPTTSENDGPAVVNPDQPATTQDSTPVVVEVEPRQQIATALERIRESYARVAAELPADRERPDWQLYFEPEDAFETALYARDESGRVLQLTGNVTADEIETLELAAAWQEQLFPVVETPPDEVVVPDETVVDVTPTEPDWPAELAAGVLMEPSEDQLTSVLGSIAPPDLLERTNPPLSVLAGILESVEVGERSADNGVNIRMVLKGGAATTHADFTLEPSTDRWLPAAGNATRLRGLLASVLTEVQSRVSTVADEIQQSYLDGKLVEAYRAYEQAQSLASALQLRELAEPVARLEEAHRRLPPVWRNPGGYQESAERDEDLGYPQTITMDGRTLLLVSVPPNDPLWNEILVADQAHPATREAAGYALVEQARKSPSERPWHIFYIESAEAGGPVEGDARSVARRQAGRDLPTTDQWLLAALKLRTRGDASGFFGGLWDWCLKGTQTWVCGGCDALHAEYMPWPDDRAGLTEVWAWLNNALVSQPRQRGDSLAGVRTLIQPG